MTVDQLIEKLKALPRYDVVGPDGHYDTAGTEAGSDYVSAYDLDKVLEEYELSKR